MPSASPRSWASAWPCWSKPFAGPGGWRSPWKPRASASGSRTWIRTATFTSKDAAVLLAGIVLGTVAVGAAVLAGTYNLVWG
ncbi:hypothetical protein AAHB37_14030 [Glutamicibacter halophytocola]|uniref:hypothetical protein n=1 Tax=Glutamicibacter halophytocola TaxID=1933880 RepID=UPI00321BC0E9